jgi:Leucine-rich repeat (LRR) protein
MVLIEFGYHIQNNFSRRNNYEKFDIDIHSLKILEKWSRFIRIPGTKRTVGTQQITTVKVKSTVPKLEGLYHLDNLRTIIMDFCEIKRIENLHHHTFLKRLNLGDNEIERIENLVKCFSLDYLNLENNLIQKIENLSNLRKLRTLNLSKNAIETIEGLSSLVNLEKLGLSHNKISVIQGLEKLESLQELDLSFNEIQKIENLSTLINLKKLDLGFNKIEEITNLSPLSNLKYLYMDGNKIKTLNGVLDAPSLESINFRNNLLTELNFDTLNLPNLEYMHFEDNRIENVIGLQNLKKMRKIFLNMNKIKSFNNFGEIKKVIDEIDLDHNPIEEFGIGCDFKYVEKLSIRNRCRKLKIKIPKRCRVFHTEHSTHGLEFMEGSGQLDFFDSSDSSLYDISTISNLEQIYKFVARSSYITKFKVPDGLKCSDDIRKGCIDLRSNPILFIEGTVKQEMTLMLSNTYIYKLDLTNISEIKFRIQIRDNMDGWEDLSDYELGLHYTCFKETLI